VDGIKIACDFVSFQNLATTHRLVEEFRQHRLGAKSGDDVLSLYATLYSAYVSLPALQSQALPMARIRLTDPPAMPSTTNSASHSHTPSSPPPRPRKKKRIEEDRSNRAEFLFSCSICAETKLFNRNGLIQHL
jgi:hypothetical protein